MAQDITTDDAETMASKSRSGSNPSCHKCSQRRIKCDGAIPRCEKCVRKGIQCPGYGIRYRFNHGVASRGKLAGRTNTALTDSNVSAHDQQVCRTGTTSTLMWPDGTVTSNANSASRSFFFQTTANIPMNADATFAADSVDTLISTPSTFDIQFDPIMSDDTTPGDFLAEGASGSAILFDDQSEAFTHMSMSPVYDPACRPSSNRSRIPAPLEMIDSRIRQLFDHFSSTVAPVMVVVDCPFNGYRNLILPLACEDELVKAAVCVASLHHLAHQQPQMRKRAELGFQSILGQLRQRTSTRTDLVDVPAWTTLIVLLTAETINGGSNLPYLFKILQHLATANMEYGRNSVMQSFLIEQTRMMTLFAQPLLEESAGAMTLTSPPEEYFDFISNVATFQPSLAREIEIYKAAIRSAGNLYIKRATTGPPHTETVQHLDQLMDLCTQIQPDTPGHHTLVWTYFIAAAESSEIRHRHFFTARLQEVYTRTKFRNIPSALAALQQIWEVQAERRWTEILSEVMPVFII